MSCDMLELMDLPEPILLQIMGYLDYDFLRHVASKVSIEWKRLAHSQVLWSRASLSIFGHECWDKAPVEEFVRNILVTPYLHHLTVSLSSCEEDILSTILEALVATQCRLHKLYLAVDDYGPEIMLFLQQHPELRELELSDNATDDDYAAGVAATVGRVIPRLISLTLSLSGLLNMPKTGLLLASPPVPNGEDHKLNPADTAMYIPAGSEDQDPQGVLDLRNVDDVDGEIVSQNQPQGLQCLEFTPYGIPLDIDPSSTWGTTAKNVAALVRAHKETLKRAKISLPCPEVCVALAECTKLEELSVVCDPTGSGFCAMLESLRLLRRLHLEVPTPLGAQGLTTVLQTLGTHAPRLDQLTLSSWRPIQELSSASAASTSLFPGFKALQAVLLGRGGSAALRELQIYDMGPVGRAAFLELASLAAAHPTLSLRKLHLSDCACSGDRSWSECRDRAEDALRAAMPHLEYTADCVMGFDDRYDIGYLPIYSCDCEQRRPHPGHRRGGRGGRGRGGHR